MKPPAPNHHWMLCQLLSQLSPNPSDPLTMSVCPYAPRNVSPTPQGRSQAVKTHFAHVQGLWENLGICILLGPPFTNQIL